MEIWDEDNAGCFAGTLRRQGARAEFSVHLRVSKVTADSSRLVPPLLAFHVSSETIVTWQNDESFVEPVSNRVVSLFRKIVENDTDGTYFHANNRQAFLFLRNFIFHE